MKYILLIVTIILISACGSPPLTRMETAAPLVQTPVSPIKGATATAELIQPEKYSIEDIQVNVVTELEKQFVEMAATNRLPTQDSKTLTPSDLKVRFEKWSPDGQQMLLRVSTGNALKGRYSYDPPELGQAIFSVYDLWLADAAGTPVSVLADTVFWYAWSPDGKMIAYIHRTVKDGIFNNELWVMDADGKHQRKLLSNARSVAWLDNQTIMFVVSESEQLELVNIHNKKVNPFTIDGLAQEHSQVILYDLSPDRQKLAFSARGDTKVRIADLTEGQVKLVTEIEVPDLSRLRWSPDSNRLAFSSLCSKPEQNPACQQISIVQTDGTIVAHINHRPDTNVSWSPDGRWIAFQETNRVYMADAETGQFKVLHTFPSGNQNTTESVDWSPVGNQIGLNQDSSGIATLLLLQTTR